MWHVLLTDAHEMAALGALRSLRRGGARVTLACPRGAGLPASRGSRYAGRVLPCPHPWHEHQAYREWLLAQARSGDYQAVLPISEASIVAAEAVRAEVPGLAWLMPPPAALPYTLSKYQATHMAQSLGLPVPRTVFVDEWGGPRDVGRLAGLAYPLVIKTDNCLLPDGTYVKGHSTRVRTPEEAVIALAEHEGTRGAVMAQELVPGHGAGVFLLRHGGAVHLRFAHRRLHEVPYTGGYSSLRESCHDDELMARGEALLSAIGYEGAAMVEFRRGEDGVAYFLEINGRLWGSLALALHAGADFPRALLECAQHDRPLAPQPPYPDGLRCRNVLPGELLHLQSVLRAPAGSGAPPRGRALAEFIALFFDPRIRHDHLWASDPGPALVQALAVGGTLLGKGLGWLPRLVGTSYERLLRAGQRRRQRGLVRRLRRAGPPRVLFVCLGNICRSPFAAAYWTRLGGTAASAGFHPQAGRTTPPRCRALAQLAGVDLAGHRSQPLSAALLDAADVVVVMDMANLRALRRAYPAAAGKALALGLFDPEGPQEIADPYGLRPAEALQIYRGLARALDGLWRALQPEPVPPR